MMRKIPWMRIVFGGLIWVAACNAAWGVARFGFMRNEWARASSASGRAMPWTTDFWMIWIPLTIPFGLAIAAYLHGAPQRVRPLPTAVGSSFGVWILSSLGMAVGMKMPARVMVLDSATNLVALVLASLAIAWRVARPGPA